MARVEYQIVIVDRLNVWNKATAAALVRDLGVPPKIAAEWAKIRRSMSPSVLKRKAYEVRN